MNTAKGEIRLLLLTPVPPPEGWKEEARALPKKEYLLHGTTVDTAYCPGAPESYERRVDRRRAVPMIVDRTRWAQQQGYDAVVLRCMVDPGLAEAKQAVRIPVVGLGEASRAVAALVGSRASEVFPRRMTIRQLVDAPDSLYPRLLQSGRRQVQQGGADVLIPDCAYLGPWADSLQTELGVPVLAGEDIALRLAELLVVFGLRREESWVESTRAARWRRPLGRAAARGWRTLATWLPWRPRDWSPS